MTTFEFDALEGWEPHFAEWMREIAPSEAISAAKQPQEFVEDAGDIFIHAIGKKKLSVFLRDKLSNHSLRVFHGTRVSDNTLSLIKQEGLKPLKLASRRETLVADLNDHPEWTIHESRLDEVLYKYGPGWERGGAGRREDGCVHACLSRNGLVKGCNHYLTHGAEVDNHITRDLFSNNSGLALLEKRRRPVLVSFVLTFEQAETAANPYQSEYEGLPFLTGKFFNAWAFRLSNTRWTPSRSREDIALRVPRCIPPHQLSIELLTDADLKADRT